MGQTSTDPTMIFVMGILGIVLCAVCGPIAWTMGNAHYRECIAEGIEPDGMAVAGRILGMVGTAMLALQVLSMFLTLGLVVLSLGVTAL